MTNDEVADMVLAVVREVVVQVRRGRIYGVEPTGVNYDPEMAPWVEKRSSERGAA